MRKLISPYLLPLIALLFSIICIFPANTLAYYAKAGTTVDLPSSTSVTGSSFLAGNTVTINGTYNGDVFCAGQNVYINAHVTGDVICAAQTIQLQGTVDGNIRAAAQSVNITGSIGKNASILAQSLEIPGSVKGELMVYAQQAHINGSVGSDMYGGMQNATIGGRIGGNVDLSTEALDVTSDATILGNLVYRGPQRATIANEGSIHGTTTYTYVAPTEHKNEGFNIANYIAGVIYWILASFILGLLLVILFGKYMNVYAERIFREPIACFAYGFIPVIITPIFFFILCITIIGIPLAFVLLILWAVGLLISPIITAYAFGKWLLRTRPDTIGNSLLALLVGVLVAMIVFSIPLIGWLIGFIAMLIGFGAIFRSLLDVIQVNSVSKE